MSDDALDLIVAGAAGRMGRTLLSLIADEPELNLVGALEQSSSSRLGQPVRELHKDLPEDVVVTDEPRSVLEDGRVLIDFTRPEGTRTFLKAARDRGGALVIGTTGFSAEDESLLERVSEEVPIVRAPNMSVGINLLADMVRTATRCLGDDVDVEVTEMHHRHKEDAPSGTARMLARQVARARRQDLDDVKKIGREGFEGERPKDEIGISSLRGGDVVGDHTVIFAAEGERIEFTHRASSRETFGRGALRAARFVVRHDRGLFTMKDVLGL